MIIGAILVIGGLALTFFGYLLASETGGYYLVCTGPIFFGSILFLKGLS